MDPTTNGHSSIAVSEGDLRMSHEKIQLWMASLKGEMMDMMNRDIATHKKLNNLEPQLEEMTYRYNHLQNRYHQLATAFTELQANHESREGHKAVVLIDGDGALFNFDLIEQGQTGGGKAATRIMESIKDYMGTGRRDEIWVYVFLNKKGLRVLLQRQGRAKAMDQLDDFVIGLTEAAKTIMVVDVGQKKEAADSKVKVLLESEARSPETRKIFFAGSHDNGYVTDLRAQVTAGFKEKLVLVPSYTEVASGYKDLGLATLTMPGLFMPEKLPFMSPKMRSMAAQSSKNTPYSASIPSAPLSEWATQLSPVQGVTPLPGKKGPGAKRRGKATSSSDVSKDASDNESLATAGSGSQVNIKSQLAKMKPPPCTMHYLAGNCKFGLDCRYAHNYDLKPQYINAMRENALKTPCQAENSGDKCNYGKHCCYGHKCPYGPRCHYFTAGNCRFVQAGMHDG